MGKKPHIGTAADVAAVTVNPDPCPIGDRYTVSATGVAIAGYPNVFVYNGIAVVSVGCTYDAESGTVTGESYASWPGEATVEIRDFNTETGDVTIVATGTFTVA